MQDNTLFVTNNPSSTATYNKRALSTLWTYIKAKIPSWALTTAKPTYTATEVGAEATGAVSAHNSSTTAHSTLFANKVDKVTGKELSTNDYTTEEKNKLSGIETGAQKNVQADWNAVSGIAQILNKPTVPKIRGLTFNLSFGSNNETSVAVNNLATTDLVFVSYAPESKSAWGEAGIYCSRQAENTLYFTCETIPSEEVKGNLVIITGVVTE